jgi:hypothetical protein
MENLILTHKGFIMEVPLREEFLELIEFLNHGERVEGWISDGVYYDEDEDEIKFDDSREKFDWCKKVYRPLNYVYHEVALRDALHSGGLTAVTSDDDVEMLKIKKAIYKYMGRDYDKEQQEIINAMP